MKNINPQFKKIIITIVTVLGLFFGYKVITDTPINTLPTVNKVDSVKVDTLTNIIDTTNAE